MNKKRRIDTGLLGEPTHSYYRERRMMRWEFKTSLMSNTKWRKLFLAVQRLQLGLPICKLKWIFSDVPETLHTPTSKTLYPPRPFIDSFEFEPFALCSIHCLEFPRVALYDGVGVGTGTTYVQNVERAEQALSAVARFPMEKSFEGLQIVGHIR